MAKGKAGGITAAVKAHGGGKQSVAKGGDYGAKAMFRAASSPASVKAMVGDSFSKYKHDKS
jgi:hypothetical protein